MHVSLRSQMIAGTAALGAAAIAISPVAQPDLLPSLQRVSSPVQLSALSLANPVTAISSVVQNLVGDVFDQAFISQDLLWGDFFTNPPDYDVLYAPLNFGMIPDLTNQFSTGSLAALINNLSGYTYAGISGVGALATGVGAAIFNTPVALISAAQYLAAGDSAAALAELQTQILGPLQEGFTTAFNSVGYIVDNVIRNVQTLVTITTPTLIGGLLNDWAIGGATYLIQSAISTVTAIVGSLTTLDFAGAWNNAVNGFLGPFGTLGQIESLTTGIGIIQTFVDPQTQDPYDQVVVPSIRSVLTSVAQRTGDYADLGLGGIANNALSVAAPAAAVPSAVAGPASRVAAAPVAAPVAEAAAPAVENAAGDPTSAEDVTATVARPVAGTAADADGGVGTGTAVTASEGAGVAAVDGTTAAPKAAKHGVSRKAAKAAADN